MSDPHAAHDGAATEQIGPAGVTDREDSRAQPHSPSPERHVDNGIAEQAATAEPGPSTTFFDAEEISTVRSHWRDLQAHFVDEPRSAVQNADTLVADLMQRLAQMFAAERDQLESHWAKQADASTEDLRQGLQRYRSFFERLLAAGTSANQPRSTAE